jgi:hypothetical protein
MNKRFAATVELQRPSGRTPDSAEFCPTCNRLSDLVLVTRDGAKVVEVIRCRQCGDSPPLESTHERV